MSYVYWYRALYIMYITTTVYSKWTYTCIYTNYLRYSWNATIHNDKCHLVEQETQNTHYVRLRLNIPCIIFKQFLAEVFSYRKVLLRSFSICRCGASLMKLVNSTRPNSPINMAIRKFRYSSFTWQNKILCTTILSAYLWQRLQHSINFDDSNFVSIYIALKHK